MAYTKRSDGRKMDEMRKIDIKVGIIPNADGSAFFSFGDTVAIVSVYGPKPLYPQHSQDPSKGLIRCNYTMLPFSVTERARPGPSRRSQEIAKITEWALNPLVDLKEYPGTAVDVHVVILQANASTRCAGINAAALALADAGIPMKEMVSAVSIGKIDDKIVTDITKEEEDYEEGEGATDIPMAFSSKTEELTLLQLDGNMPIKRLKEAIEAGKKACKKIHKLQEEALKKSLKEE